MTREEYIEGYASLNKAYNQIFDTLQDLMEKGFDDQEVITAFNYGLNVLDKGLDIYKDSYVDKKTDLEFKVETSDSPEESDDGKSSQKGKFKGFKVFGGK